MRFATDGIRFPNEPIDPNRVAAFPAFYATHLPATHSCGLNQTKITPPSKTGLHSASKIVRIPASNWPLVSTISMPASRAFFKRST